MTAANDRNCPDGQDTVLRVTVLDMQPIEPAIGGGRLRLLGLYHGLGPTIATTYVGTYDWPGMPAREQRLSSSLLEVLVPLSDEHFAASERLSTAVGGKVVIDSSFPSLASLSPAYVERARREAAAADVVVFSHPWVHPLVEEVLSPDDQLVVYDAQNVEGYLRTLLLDDHVGAGHDIVREVVRTEDALCAAADLILVCSHADREQFHRIYGVPFERLLVVPNGTFTTQRKPVSSSDKARQKRSLGLGDGHVAIFLASDYAPNRAAAEFIVRECATRLPEVLFVICGNVGEGIQRDGLTRTPTNVRVTGTVDEHHKHQYLEAADVALNPMSAGSGTNIKMLEYMAAALPILTTEVGSRGIERAAVPAYRTARLADFPQALADLLQDDVCRRRLSEGGVDLADVHYSWERISAELGRLLSRRYQRLRQPEPTFSVVIPTYERHDLLPNVLRHLRNQTYRDFELIVVDQSEIDSRPQVAESAGDMDCLYVHTDVADVVRARNLGAQLARGRYLAFTDDDCEPRPDWLERAADVLADGSAIGIEGAIVTDHEEDVDYRAVTNRSVAGIGFMTANLILARGVFNAVNGFDPLFGPTPFREDSDLGWRASSHGTIVTSDEVTVYHPPHPRTGDRESSAGRARFFRKDPLLLSKHPDLYRALFVRENHWKTYPGFWANFIEGATMYEVPLPDYYYLRLGDNVAARLRDGGDLSDLLADDGPRLQRAGPDFEIAAPGPFDARRFAEEREALTPGWFQEYWWPGEEARRHWEAQLAAARRGDEHELPAETMRSPENRLHQRMAMEFWAEVPRDFHSILDVGCSDGFMVRIFQSAGKEAVGVNDFLFPTDSLYAEEHGLDVREMDMHFLDFPEQRFDAVWCRHTLEHAFSPLRVLAEIHRVLKPNGYLFVAIPPPPDPQVPYPGHWHQIPDYQLAYLLRMHGFSILRLETCLFSHEDPDDNLEIRSVSRKQ